MVVLINGPLNEFLLLCPQRGAKYCDEYVCLFFFSSICLSTHISQKPHSRTLPNLLCMLPMAMAQSSFVPCDIMLCPSGFVDDAIFLQWAVWCVMCIPSGENMTA